MNLYLFNPENDLAIAFGGENYTPPPAAQLIGKELSPFPFGMPTTTPRYTYPINYRPIFFTH